MWRQHWWVWRASTAPYSRLSAHDCHYCAYRATINVPEYVYISAQPSPDCGAINVCIKPHLEQQGRLETRDVSGLPSGLMLDANTPKCVRHMFSGMAPIQVDTHPANGWKIVHTCPSGNASGRGSAHSRIAATAYNGSALILIKTANNGSKQAIMDQIENFYTRLNMIRIFFFS